MSKYLAQTLGNLGVEMTPALPHFQDWLCSNYPHWKDWRMCFEYLPAKHTILNIQECTVAYLFMGDTIVHNSLQWCKAGLFVFGALPDGSWLALNTYSLKQDVGKIGTRWLSVDDKDMPREAFWSFDMSYEEWLTMMIKDPENVEFG